MLQYLDQNVMSEKEFNKCLSYLQKQRARAPIDEAEVRRLLEILQKEQPHVRADHRENPPAASPP
jgi:hypothetical protein